METGKRILVIDDDPDIGLMMKMMLVYKGYMVTLLDNAGQVEETLRKNRFDLIFMDMLLSGVNGVDVCTAIKSNTDYAGIPLIMMSAHPDAQKICLLAGANDFISKPFETDDLLSKIARLLKNKNIVS
ncbi:MAG: response regulator [Bacteroidota bacterium]